MKILNQTIENWSKQPLIIRILFILVIIAFIYDMLTGIAFSIYFAASFLSLTVAEFIYWLVYTKEE